MRKAEDVSVLKSSAAIICFAVIFVCATRTAVFARSGDTTADHVLGQPDLYHNSPNTVDGNVFNQPNQLVLDKSVTPNRLYIADWQNNRVLGFHSVGALQTGSYADVVIGQPDFFSAGCPFPATQRSLCSPAGIAVDSAGNLYVADTNDNRVLEFANPFNTMKATGQRAGFQASLVLGQPDFSSNNCNQSASVSAKTLCNPVAAALDTHNNLFVADANNQRVLEYNVGFVTGASANRVFGQLGSFTTNSANKGGVSARSLDLSPQPLSALAVDPASNALYVADTINSRVLKFNSPLTSDSANAVFGQLGSLTQNACDTAGGPNANSLCDPLGVAIDKGGDVFIADNGANRVLEYKPPIAANPAAAVVFGGTCGATAATLCGPRGIGVDSSGNLYVDDTGNNRMLEFLPPFPAYPFAQQLLGQPDTIHNAPNTVDPEGMNNPTGIVLDRSVTPNHLYIADGGNHRILGYRNAASFLNSAPADLVIGQPDFYSSGCNQTGGQPNARTLCNPAGLAVDKSGNLFVADSSNNRVLEYNPPPFNSGYTFNQPAFAVFGQGGSFATGLFGGCNDQNAGHTPTSASLCNPSGLAISTASGKLYVADQNNHRVLEFDPPFAANPVAAKVFGQAVFTANLCNRTSGAGMSGQNTLCSPSGIAVDAAGNLYVADTSNNRALEFTAPLVTGGNAALVFGQAGIFALNGCNDVGTNSDSLCTPQGIGVDAIGNVYIADGTNGNSNNRVLEYNTPLHRTSVPGSGDTTADRVFGQGGNFTSFACNLGGTAPSPNTLCFPWNVAFDGAGNLYISDSFNNRVVEYDTP